MSAIEISFGLLIALFAILLLYKIRKLKPQVTGYGSQRMCPFCGLITSRLKADCLECGRPLTAADLVKAKDEIVLFIRSILQNLETFATSKSYKV